MSKRRRAKLALYRSARAAGLFGAARRATAAGLRILCYHGVAPGDLAEFQPGLFHRPETFRARMEWIVREGYPVLPLGEALERLDAGTLPPAATVITIDDGFAGLEEHALPVLRELELPATVYVVTRYVERQLPVLILALQYVVWRSPHRDLDLRGLGEGLEGRVELGDDAARRRLAVDLTTWARKHLPDEPTRSAWAARIAERLGVDWDRLVAGRALHLLSPERLRGLAAEGVDLQLHSHTHVLDGQRAQLEVQIRTNRAILEPLAGRPLTHFCYPSGRHWPEQERWLEELGIESATTCDPGLNHPDTPRRFLHRFVDAEDVDPVEFDAELSGFAELLRRGRRTISWTGRAKPR